MRGHYVEPFKKSYKDIAGDGHIPCFHADGNHWSFVKQDASGKLLEVWEKSRIFGN